MCNINIGITIDIQNVINIHLHTHHGIIINIDTIDNMKRQLLNTCMLTNLGLGTAIAVVSKGG